MDGNTAGCLLGASAGRERGQSAGHNFFVIAYQTLYVIRTTHTHSFGGVSRLVCQFLQLADVLQVRSMAAVLLRRIYTSSFEEFWPLFPPEAQAQLKERTLLSIQTEQNGVLRKKICECGAEFARNLLGELKTAYTLVFQMINLKFVI